MDSGISPIKSKLLLYSLMRNLGLLKALIDKHTHQIKQEADFVLMVWVSFSRWRRLSYDNACLICSCCIDIDAIALA